MKIDSNKKTGGEERGMKNRECGRRTKGRYCSRGAGFSVVPFFLALLAAAGCWDVATEPPRRENSFWNDGEAFFDTRPVPPAGRVFSVTVAMDGSVLVGLGRNVRRSEDGGETWQTGINSGGRGSRVVDENTGDILAMPNMAWDGEGNRRWYRSTDHGKTWEPEGRLADIEHNLDTLEVEGRPVFRWWPVDSRLHLRNYTTYENGLTLRYGEHRGRLVVPARVQRRLEGQTHPGKLDLTVVVYSDDGGRTWKQSAPTLPFGTDEAAIAELSDGTIYHNSRSNIHHGNKHVSLSRDGGETWGEHRVCDYLPDGPKSGPRVYPGHYGLMGGLVRLPVDGEDILVFSNVDSEEGRRNMTLWASFDGGRTWPVRRQVDEGPAGYSGLDAGREGTVTEGMIFLVYEEPHGREPPRLVRFNLAWLTGGVDWEDFLD